MTQKFDSDTIETAFTNFLHIKRLRKTPERYAILHKILELDTHFEIDALHDAIEGDGYHVSRATVYNTVELLEKAGLLRKNMFGQTANFELNRDGHIHLVCKRCGKVREMENPLIASHIMQLDPDDFKPESYAITLFGLCGECAAKEL